MTSCERIRELLPWYARRSLPVEEMLDVAEHLASCDTCRTALAEEIRLGMEIESSLRGAPGLPEEAWTRVVERTHGKSITNVDIGSFILGFSFGARMQKGRIPVHGDLRLLGRKYRLFSVGKED